MQNKYVHFNEKNYRRIIVVSDIHAHFELFNQLLEKVNIKVDDLLVINGDFINRGEDSLRVLMQCRELANLDNCIVLAGNHEYFVYDALNKKRYHKKILHHIDNGKYPTMIKDLYKQLVEIDYKHLDKPEKFTKKILKRNSAVFDFILSRPIVLEGKHHIIVHSAYEDSYTLEDNFYDYIKNDAFISETHHHPKIIIVGHWPAGNIVGDEFNNEPRYLKDKNIYAIDGGVGVKADGELNALIITPSLDGYDYSFEQVNNFLPAKVVKEVKYPQEPMVHAKYPHYDLTLVKKGKLLSEFVYNHTGEHLSIFNDLTVKTPEGHKLLWDYVNHFFNLSIGDEVLVVNQIGNAAEVKYGRQFYWVDATSLEL